MGMAELLAFAESIGLSIPDSIVALGSTAVQSYLAERGYHNIDSGGAKDPFFNETTGAMIGSTSINDGLNIQVKKGIVARPKKIKKNDKGGISIGGMVLKGFQDAFDWTKSGLGAVGVKVNDSLVKDALTTSSVIVHTMQEYFKSIGKALSLDKVLAWLKSGVAPVDIVKTDDGKAYPTAHSTSLGHLASATRSAGIVSTPFSVEMTTLKTPEYNAKTMDKDATFNRLRSLGANQKLLDELDQTISEYALRKSTAYSIFIKGENGNQYLAYNIFNVTSDDTSSTWSLKKSGDRYTADPYHDVHGRSFSFSSFFYDHTKDEVSRNLSDITGAGTYSDGSIDNYSFFIPSLFHKEEDANIAFVFPANFTACKITNKDDIKISARYTYPFGKETEIYAIVDITDDTGTATTKEGLGNESVSKSDEISGSTSVGVPKAGESIDDYMTRTGRAGLKQETDVLNPDGSVATTGGYALPNAKAIDDTISTGVDLAGTDTKAQELARSIASSTTASETIASTSTLLPPAPPTMPISPVSVDIPTSDMNLGLIIGYAPTVANLKAFSEWLWQDDIITNIKKRIQDPMQAIISLQRIYTGVTTGESVPIVLGNIQSSVSAPVITNRYEQRFMGDIDIPYISGDFTDFTETEVSIYLPFIGIRTIDAGLVVGASLSLSYNIDVMTGSCVAQITVTRDKNYGVCYQFSGDMSEKIPLTASNFNGLTNAILQTTGLTASATISGGVGAGVIAGASSIAGQSGLANIEHASALSGNVGALASRQPFVIIKHKNRFDTNNGSTIGRPTNRSTKISSLSGFVQGDGLQGTFLRASADEIDEIKSMFSSGVVIKKK